MCTVTRPLTVDGSGDVGLTNLGEPGEKFSTTNFVTSTQLSFPDSQAAKVAAIDGVQRVSGGLTLSAIQVSGRVPKHDGLPQGPKVVTPAASGAPARPRRIDFDQQTVTGVDTGGLGAIGRDQLTTGRWFSAGDAREAILDVACARRKGLAVGDSFKLKDKAYKVVGLVRTPIGGQASDMYVELGQLQALSDRKGRVNVLFVRADDGVTVGAVAKRIEASLTGSS